MIIIKDIYHFLYQALTKIEAIILASATIALAILNVANVPVRMLGFGGIPQSEELNIILIINITFAGTSYAARKARHIRMTAIVDILPKKINRILNIFMYFTTGIIFFALFYFSIQYIDSIIKSKSVYTSIGLPRYYFFLWIPVSLFSTGLEYILTAWKNLITKDIYIASQIKGEGYDDAQDIAV